MEYNESNHDEKMEDQHKDNNKTNRIRSQMNINDLSNPIEDDRSASTTNSTSVSPTTKKSMNHNESKENRVSSNVVRSLNLPPTQSQSLINQISKGCLIPNCHGKIPESSGNSTALKFFVF